LSAIAEMSDGAPAPVDELPVDPDDPDDPEDPEDPEPPKGEVPAPDEPLPPGVTTPGLDALVVVVPAGHTRRPSPAPATTARATARVATTTMGDRRPFGVLGCW
jgi:hypothetical protein